MAHIAKLGGLTDELVALLTGASPKSDSARFNIHRETALRALRFHNHPRTNQFDVTSRLDGLEEKFRVYNEDPLADALRERLDRLPDLELKWTPEILHLLLELSDKPVSKSRLEDLDLLKEPEPDTGPSLRWEDLAAENPALRDKSIWRNVNFEDNSEDDELEDSQSDDGLTDTTALSSIEGERGRFPEDFSINPSSRADLTQLQNEQFWLKIPMVDGVKLETVKRPITEIQAIREVLFMLGGLPTSIFQIEGSNIRPCLNFTLKHSSPEAFFKLTKSFADHGAAVLLLRKWAGRSQPVPLLQILQNSTLARIADFDTHLSREQHKLVSPSADVVVSLLQIQQVCTPYFRCFDQLSTVIKTIDSDQYGHAFRYLEMLYDETCTSQMAGDHDIYIFMGTIFFECFLVYLRPLRTWMEDGELEIGDKIFFVSEAPGDVELSSLWQSRFKIRRTSNGVLHAPKFLQAASNKIFNTGKSVVVLKHLNQFDLLRSARGGDEPPLDFNSVCNQEQFQLVPFTELFNSAFDNWVRSKHHHASYLLRKTLFDSCGLHTALDALSHIYFIEDGIVGSVFTNSIYDKLDALNTSWNDRFTLTEIAQSTFGSIPSVAPENLRIAVRSLSRKHQDVAICRKSVNALSILEVKYLLSWPIQIILAPENIAPYKKVFTFLLQVRRSSHILSRQRLVFDKVTSTNSSDERALYYLLRTRLLWFTQLIYYYLTSLVLKPCSDKMQEDLRAAEDVDSMIAVHSAYIKLTTDQALLGGKLELIHKTVLKILDLSIKLEDAQAVNSMANKEVMDRQQELMDISMASLGLRTPQRKRIESQSFRKSVMGSRRDIDSSSDDDGDEVDFSILSYDDGKEDLLYVEKLRMMKADFDRLIRFVSTGLKGVARAGGDPTRTRSWDTLAEMLESGIGNGIGKGVHDY